MATVEVYKRSGEAVDADPQTPGDQPEATRYELVGNLLRERKPNGVVADHVYAAYWASRSKETLISYAGRVPMPLEGVRTWTTQYRFPPICTRCTAITFVM
ncbi:MAG: hypothetical protein RBS80_03375 [Thermoguttaceae bacterium]|nr:hypothetical protein [Thermoguttaceae bacterium]